MSWRDELRPASFRGVEFHVLSAGGTFGRRVQLHEYPFRDLPYVEDLGRRARSMRIEAIVLGDDYMARRDALIAAAEQAGPGKLVHPFYGELTVSLDDGGIQIDESTASGGSARITFSVIESGEARFPTAQIATQDVVASRADDAQAEAAESFGDRFNAGGLPAFAFDSALKRVQEALDQVETFASVAAAAKRGDVLGVLSVLRPSLTSQLLTPMDLAQQVQGLYSRLRLAIGPGNAVRSLASVTTFGAGIEHIPTSTPTRRQQRENDEAIVELVRTAAATERARAVAELELGDYTSAVTVRDSLVDQIDQVADIAGSDNLFQALSALRAAVVRDINTRGADLARIVEITPAESLPALVLAYDLYEDPSRDAEIIARNAIAHPGFLPGGQPLEVQTDV